MNEPKNILFFSETSEADFEKLGGKGMSLARMALKNFPVPPGFCVTTDAYSLFLETTGILNEIDKKLKNINFHSVEDLEETSADIRDLVLATPMPAAVEKDIIDAYHYLSGLCQLEDRLPVAVRSSATAEDLPEASFAGQQDTYLWVVEPDSVVGHVKRCWASLYTSRAIMYRKDRGISEADVAMCVVVQKMANARTAGVVMTLNPLNGDRSKIVIDATWGLGEAVVSGKITPDNFLVDKVILEIIEEKIHYKPFELVPGVIHKHLVKKDVESMRATQPSLSREEVIEICKLAKTIEKEYGCPQDIEWAIDKDLPAGQNLMLLQSRPETVWSQRKATGKAVHEKGMNALVYTLLNPLNKQ